MLQLIVAAWTKPEGKEGVRYETSSKHTYCLSPSCSGGILKRGLEEQGFSVVFCRSSKEAVERLSSHWINLIILDADGMRGEEGCKELVRSSSNIYVLLYTALPRDRLNDLAFACSKRIPKTFSTERLVEEVVSFLQGGEMTGRMALIESIASQNPV
jgi:DNA-binding response OmpR family regulator